MAVTAIFVGCWLPLNVVHLTLDYYEKVTSTLINTVAYCLSDAGSSFIIVFYPAYFL